MPIYSLDDLAQPEEQQRQRQTYSVDDVVGIADPELAQREAQAQARKTVPGAGERLVRGVGRTALGVAKMPYEIGKAAITPPQSRTEALLGPIGTLAKRLLYDPQAETARVAREAAERGETAKSMIYSAGAGLPLLGPMAVAPYQAAERGDLAGAIGEGLATAALFAAPEALRRGGPPPPPPPSTLGPRVVRQTFGRPGEAQIFPRQQALGLPRQEMPLEPVPPEPRLGLPSGVEVPVDPNFVRTGSSPDWLRGWQGRALNPSAALPPGTTPLQLPSGLAPGETFRRTASGSPETYPAPEYALRPARKLDLQPLPAAKEATVAPSTPPVKPAPPGEVYPGARGKVANTIREVEGTFDGEGFGEQLAGARQQATELKLTPQQYTDFLAFELRRARAKTQYPTAKPSAQPAATPAPPARPTAIEDIVRSPREERRLNQGVRDEYQQWALGEHGLSPEQLTQLPATKREQLFQTFRAERWKAEAQGAAETPALPAGPIPPGEVGRMNTADLSIDPQRFQFKLGVDAEGTHGALSGRPYKPDLAGTIGVWEEPGTGKTFVVNGHNRYALAKEAGVPAQNVLKIVAKTAEEARAKGALMNIAEGNGTPIDVAKFLRDTGIDIARLKEHGITRSSKLARDGMALADLDQGIFDRVAMGQIPESRGIAIGEALKDPNQQWAVLDLIKESESRGRKVSDSTVTEAIRLAQRSGEVATEQTGLFGTEAQGRSTALDKAELSDYIRQQIGKEKRLFGYASSEARAAELAKGGEKNVLDVKANREIAQGAAQAQDAYDRFSSYKGPINDILESAANRIAAGEDANAVRAQAYSEVRSALEETLGGGKGKNLPGPSGQGILGGPEAEGGFLNRNTIFTKDSIAQDIETIRRKTDPDTLRDITSAFDPELARAFARVGAAYIEAGVRNFAAWSTKMVEDFGERIKPVLREVWASALQEGKKAPRPTDRAVFTTTEVADKAAMVEQQLARLTEPSRIVMERGAETMERGTVPRDIRDQFYGSERQTYEATYGQKVSVRDMDQAYNALKDAHSTAVNWLKEMERMGDEPAALVGRAAVDYLNQASKLFKETGTIAGRVLQARQRPAVRGGLPQREVPPGKPLQPGRTVPDLIEQAKTLVAQAQEQLTGLKTFRQREPVTTGLVNAIRDKRWMDAARYAVDQLRLNLFSMGSWTLDAIGNATEMGAQRISGMGHDLVYTLKSGEPTFPSLTGFVQALKRRTAQRGIPMDAAIEQAFGQTAGGELVGRGVTGIPGKRMTMKERLARPGTFTYRTTGPSKALDVVQGVPLYAKGAMDMGAKRISATAILYRDAIKAADAQKLRGARRQTFIDQFLEQAPEKSIQEAIAEGNKAGFNRPLSLFEERVSRSIAYRLLGDLFARWPFQFTRWAGEMLGYNRPLLEKVLKHQATAEEVAGYMAKTAAGYGGLLLLNNYYDRMDFNSMEYVTENGDRVRVAGREPVATAFWMLALIKGDLAKASAGLKYVSVPGARMVQEGGAGGGLLGGFFNATGQAVRNPQNDPRALRRELTNTINRAIPGQAVLGFVKSVTDPTLREGLGANLPGASFAYPGRVNPTTGEPLRPMQRVPGTKLPLPALTGTPVPGMARITDPTERLLNRYGMVVYRGPRQPIAGFPAANVPNEYRREWEQIFGQERSRLLKPWADKLAGGTLEDYRPEFVRSQIQKLDSQAARNATQRINAKNGDERKLPRRPTFREQARPTIYQEQAQ